jgi:antitoxin (DNA-binding transcriptional repressor) of toxin-antitoxin stability system
MDMSPFLTVFTVQNLGERTEDLVHNARQGRLSLITNEGRPAILAVPFDERLLVLGLHRTMAMSLFESGQVTLGQGARLADLSLEEFITLLGSAGISVVNYPPEDLDRDLEIAAKLAR